MSWSCTVPVGTETRFRLLRDRWERDVPFGFAIRVRRAVRPCCLTVRYSVTVAGSGEIIGLDLIFAVVGRRPVRVVTANLDVVRRKLADLTCPRVSAIRRAWLPVEVRERT